MAAMSVRGEWMGDQIKGQVRKAAAQGLHYSAQNLLDKSLAVVPRETAELAGSGGTDVDESTLIASVYYDDARDIKTIKQHEDLTYHHPRGGEAKFLEKPASRHKGDLVESLARFLKGVGW